MPISWHSPPKCLQASPWPNSCMTFVTPSTTASRKALWMLKNWWNSGSLERNTSNSTATSVSAESASRQHSATVHGEKNQRTYGIEPVQQPLGIEPLEADAEDVADGGEQLLAFALVAAFAELAALAGHVGHHQPAAVQHAQELLQFLQVIFCGGNSSSKRSLISSRLVWPSSICRMAYSSSWKRK